MDLSWDYFDYSLQGKTHSWPKKQQFDYVWFQNFDTEPKPPLITKL